MTGYRDATYAQSFAEIGTPRRLARSGGWIVLRRIPECDRVDAMGTYPLLSCENWRALTDDIDELRGELVSLVVVTDPLGDFVAGDVARAFPERFVPLRDHFIVDCAAPDATTPHHRYYAARAARGTEILETASPVDHLEEWIALYGTLARRHTIGGVRAFSRSAFARQLATPGMRMFLARREGNLIGAHLWLSRGDVAHSHLAASSEAGYACGVSYALYRAALDYFRPRARLLDLGGAPSEGLCRFKRGWATGTRPAYLGGRIFDFAAYRALARGNQSDYFPAYRARGQT